MLTPDVKRLMAAIVLVALCAELAYVVTNISAMPVFIKSIGLPDWWIGAAATAFILVEGILKSPFGLLGDRIGRKTLIFAGPAISIFTCLLTPHIHNGYVLVGLRVLDGIGAAALWPAAFSIIGDHVPEQKRSAAMSLFNLSYLLGIALGPMVGGGINDYAYHSLHFPLAVSKEASFYVAAILFAITAIVAIVLLPGGGPQHHSVEPGEGGFNFADFRKMLGRMPAMLTMTFVIFLGIGLIMAYVKIFAMDTFHVSESQFGRLLVVPALIIAAVSIPLGSLGDKIGKARAVQLGIGTCTIAFWLLLLTFSESTIVLFGALIGVGFVVAFPSWMALVSETCEPSQRGAAVGAVGTAQGIGAILGVVISSFLYERPGFTVGPITIPKHGLPFLGCAVMLAVGFALALLTIRENKACDVNPTA